MIGLPTSIGIRPVLLATQKDTHDCIEGFDKRNKKIKKINFFL